MHVDEMQKNIETMEKIEKEIGEVKKLISLSF